MHKKHHPGLTYFTPNINIFRDPRWGRGQETPGEDPYLTSHYAAVLVMALQYGKTLFVQHTTETKKKLYLQQRPRVAATCKHFAAYSLETHRFNFSANVEDERDWKDTYLPAFDACIHAERYLMDHYLFHFGDDTKGDYAKKHDDGFHHRGVLGVMCSYSTHPHLKTLLSDEWNITGLQYIIYPRPFARAKQTKMTLDCTWYFISQFGASIHRTLHRLIW